jgi:ribosomal protein S1
MATVSVGDIVAGTVVGLTRSGATVLLDGFADEAVGDIGSLDLTWRPIPVPSGEILGIGDRVSAEVIAVDPESGRIRLSRSATENPQLWAFLKALRPGQRLSGTVAAIKRFGVFVDLDDGPKHPMFPGVGFITIPELSWRWFEDPAEIVSVSQRVTCEVLVFDTTNGEARLSLRATQPDPFARFAEAVQVGQTVRGPVTKLVPFGAFVRVWDGIEGLIHISDLSENPIDTPDQAVQVGEEVTVTITEIDRPWRRVKLSRVT